MIPAGHGFTAIARCEELEMTLHRRLMNHASPRIVLGE